MLAASGGTGKTQALVQLAVAVASGKPWLDTYAVPDPGPVLLVLGEEDDDDMHRRIRGAVKAMNAWPERLKIADNLHALSLCGKPAGMTGEYGGQNGSETGFFREFRDGLKAWPKAAWRLIILDPASRFLGPDAEVDNAAATRWIEAAERLTQLPGRPTVLFAHHMNKSGLSGGTDQGAARGSSALTDGARWQANLERVSIPDLDANGLEQKTNDNKLKTKVDPDRAILKVVKANNCRIQEPLALARDIDHGGYLKPDAAPPVRQAKVAKAATVKAKADPIAGQKAVLTAAKAALAAFPADGDTKERKRLAAKVENAQTTLVRKQGAAVTTGGDDDNRFD